MAVSPGAIGVLVVLAACVVAELVALGLLAAQHVSDAADAASWRAWEAHKAAPTTLASAAAADSVVRQVRAVAAGAVPRGRPTPTAHLFGSQALKCATSHSDADVRVSTASQEDAAAVGAALQAAGFSHAFTNARYALYRGAAVPTGHPGVPTMDVDVSVRVVGVPDPAGDLALLSPLARDVKGFLLWKLRQRDSPGAAPVALRTWVPGTVRGYVEDTPSRGAVSTTVPGFVGPL
jgi:hypothetical protein